MPSEYEFHVRSARTLDYLGELHPRDVIATWTRRDVAGGSFSLSVPRVGTDAALTAAHNLVEVRRDGAIEFQGLIELREVDALAKRWTLGGPDLLGFWPRNRYVGLTAADNRAGGAEDVLLDYVTDRLADVGAELDGISWHVSPSSGRGAAVEITATRRLLSAVVEEIARAGAILPTLATLPDYTGYLFAVEGVRDATTAAGAVPFAVDWDNVEKLAFRESYQHVNDLYVFGDGSGDTRNYTRVYDPDLVFRDYRREGVLDARHATTAGARTAIGELELTRQDQTIVTVAAKPFRAGGLARYRTDWDVGWDVTFAEAGLREDAVDLRIVSATVRLDAQAGEDITFELGQHRAKSSMRRLQEAISRLQIASLA